MAINDQEKKIVEPMINDAASTAADVDAVHEIETACFKVSTPAPINATESTMVAVEL